MHKTKKWLAILTGLASVASAEVLMDYQFNDADGTTFIDAEYTGAADSMVTDSDGDDEWVVTNGSLRIVQTAEISRQRGMLPVTLNSGIVTVEVAIASYDLSEVATNLTDFMFGTEDAAAADGGIGLRCATNSPDNDVMVRAMTSGALGNSDNIGLSSSTPLHLRQILDFDNVTASSYFMFEGDPDWTMVKENSAMNLTNGIVEVSWICESHYLGTNDYIDVDSYSVLSSAPIEIGERIQFGDDDSDGSGATLVQVYKTVAGVSWEGISTNYVTTGTTTGNGNWKDEGAGATLTDPYSGITATIVSATASNGTESTLNNFGVPTRGLGVADGVATKGFDLGEKLVLSFDKDVNFLYLIARAFNAGDHWRVYWEDGNGTTNSFEMTGANALDFGSAFVAANTPITIEAINLEIQDGQLAGFVVEQASNAPYDPPVLTDILPLSGGAEVELIWSGSAGPTYNILERENLVTGSWSTNTFGIPGAVMNVETVSVSTATAFFRIEQN